MTRAFTQEWLALREPADHRSRSARFRAALAARFAPAPAVHVVDLGTGTGSNLRYLAPALGSAQRWLCVDDDEALLGALPRALAAARPGATTRAGSEVVFAGPAFRARVVRQRADLAASADAIAIPEQALVTASALLDLVSETWIGGLAARCADQNACALFALNYDGEILPDPPDASDASIVERVNAHQRGDKGFGPAIGPDAPELTRAVFERHGFNVEAERTCWTIGPDEHELQQALIAGWCEAAAEIDGRSRASIDAWRGRRLAMIERGASSIVVGHEDLLATPPP